MKKIIVFMLTGILIFSVATVVFAESFADNGTQRVTGLQEKLDALFITNNFTQTQIEEMDQQYIGHFNQEWPGLLKGLRATGKMKYRYDDEAEYAYRLEEAQLNYDDGVIISLLHTNRYAEQYAATGNFNYLFSEQQYYQVNGYTSGRIGRFSEDGMCISGQEYVDLYGAIGFGMQTDTLDFLRNASQIEQMLLEHGEITVLDVKVFTLSSSSSRSFLYIKCNSREYLIKLLEFSKASDESVFGQIELYKLYTVSEVMEVVALLDKGLGKSTSATKPTYDLEGEALMADGIIQGNEKGFDPLKPLSRIEAITILVRALGLEDEQTTENSEFVDIPNNHWGKKYVNIAKEKGITYGVGNNKFAPDDKVNANQFSAMLLRNSEGDTIDWEQALNHLVERGIITAENVKAMDFFTRGDMAKIIYEARAKGLLKSN